MNFQYVQDINITKKKDSKIICKLCDKPLVDPVFCSHCSEIFCIACLTNNRCDPAFIHSLDVKNPIIQSLQELEIFCPINKHNGCGWIGMRKDYLDHCNDCEKKYEICSLCCELKYDDNQVIHECIDDRPDVDHVYEIEPDRFYHKRQYNKNNISQQDNKMPKDKKINVAGPFPNKKILQSESSAKKINISEKSPNKNNISEPSQNKKPLPSKKSSAKNIDVETQTLYETTNVVRSMMQLINISKIESRCHRYLKKSYFNIYIQSITNIDKKYNNKDFDEFDQVRKIWLDEYIAPVTDATSRNKEQPYSFDIKCNHEKYNYAVNNNIFRQKINSYYQRIADIKIMS